MPNVVDANVNKYDGRFLRKHVFVKSALQVWNLVATDSGIDNFHTQVGSFFFDRVADQPAVPTSTSTCLSD